MFKDYDIEKLERVLSEVVDNGYGISFDNFDSCDKDEVIYTVVNDFQSKGYSTIRGKYVVVGQNGTLKANDFVANTLKQANQD